MTALLPVARKKSVASQGVARLNAWTYRYLQFVFALPGTQ